jgi:predicted O-linked N-acetylglucosamine transferase (SPINDLY family)
VVVVSLRDRDGQINRRFRARADAWHDLPETLSDAQLAAGLRALNLDILVDLGGHGDGGRLRALRHRAAPVQMKWVGAQSSPTGTPNIDWMIADRWEIPPHLERFYTERALRLRDGYVCYSPPPYAPEVGPLPALRNGHLTFGCFNNLSKLTPEAISCWVRIMAALPTARLVLRNHALGDAETREGFLARCAALGLDLGRVEAHGPVNHETLLDAYNAIDISLDPFPYTGGLTVCESLWMGVPVVTLAGESFAGRHAVSHLSNVGLPDWVARSADDYVALALSRAANPQALAALRAGLRAQVAASPLGDAPRFAESLALGLRAAWREACAAA